MFIARLCESAVTTFGAWVGNHLGTRHAAHETALVPYGDGFVPVTGRWETPPSPLPVVVPVLLVPALVAAQEVASEASLDLHHEAAVSGIWGGVLAGVTIGVLSGLHPRYRMEGFIIQSAVEVKRSAVDVVIDVLKDAIYNGMAGFALSVGNSYGVAYLQKLGTPMLLLPVAACVGGAVEVAVVRLLKLSPALSPSFGAATGLVTGIAVAWF